MRRIITITQIIISVLLVAVIVIQARGTGLGSALGGAGESYHSKKGLERVFFITSIFLAGLFLLTAVINILV